MSQKVIALMTLVGCGCLFAHVAHVKLSDYGKSGLFLSPKNLGGGLLETPPPFYART
jgi:hypothetical protein